MERTDLISEYTDEVWREVNRQEQLWGIQLHADGTDPAKYKKVADRMRKACDAADDEGVITWAHIFLEEAYEALASEPNSAELKEELIQCVAVIFSWLRAIDTRP